VDEAVTAASELARARDDLAWLSAHGALAGVAAIIRERRQQIEQHGHDAQHDDEIFEGDADLELGGYAYGQLRDIGYGVADNPQRDLTRAGSLCAAELDRIGRKGRLVTPEDPK
jgi:hypothetical protein